MVLLFANVAQARSNIPAIANKDASLYHNKTVKVCGDIRHVREYKKHYYLNFDVPFPKQSVSAIVWREFSPKFTARFAKLDNMLNKHLCDRFCRDV